MVKRLILPALLAASRRRRHRRRRSPSPSGEPAVRPQYTADGALRRPADVDRWILVGASLGLGYSDATEDGPGMFHRVYLEPTAYDHYRETGRFRDGTMLALSIRQPSRRVPPEPRGLDGGGARRRGDGGEGFGAVRRRVGLLRLRRATADAPGRCRA